MTTDHERTQELLAGYVVRSLSGEDAAEADRVLTDHVPGCDECRSTLDAFRAGYRPWVHPSVVDAGATDPAALRVIRSVGVP